MNGENSELEIDESVAVEATSLVSSKEEKETRVEPSLRAEVVVFDNWCKGCGLCVAFCPHEVLEMDGGGKVHVAAPERCTACHWCDTHCPDFAIVVRRVDKALSKE